MRVDKVEIKDGTIHVSLSLPASSLFTRRLQPAKSIYIDTHKIKKDIAHFNALVLSDFKTLVGSGRSPRKAISQTNTNLKAKGNPWASYFIVEQIVRRAGGLRKNRVV